MLLRSTCWKILCMVAKMSELYKSIMTGLQEAIDDANGVGQKLPRRKVVIEPVKQYNAEEIRVIRKKTGLSQRLFAAYLGVSSKTVEAWESGINCPSGPASRMISMIESDSTFVEKYPFVVQG